jgi:hypothetical protein
MNNLRDCIPTSRRAHFTALLETAIWFIKQQRLT